MSKLIPRTQRMAHAAHAAVEARKSSAQEKVKEEKEYGSLALSLPAMILQNGLAQATGFLLAKGVAKNESAHLALLDDLAAVLRASRVAQAKTGSELHRHIIGADLGLSMVLTREALAASSWLKRYAQGVLKAGVPGKEEGSPA